MEVNSSPATPGMTYVIAERVRQIVQKGYTVERDAAFYRPGDFTITRAAIAYAITATLPNGGDVRPNGWWPWTRGAWKPGPSRKVALIKAAALLIAEIDRLEATEPNTPAQDAKRRVRRKAERPS